MIEFFLGFVKLGFVVVVIALVFVVVGYNKMRKLAENVREALSNIGVAENRKVEVINHFIASIQGYQESEKLVMLKVSQDMTVSSMQQLNQQAGSMISAINGMAQRYPDLKSSEHYSEFNTKYYECEQLVEEARKTYNQNAKEYNVRRTTIPHVVYAGLLGFHPAQYLSMGGGEATEMNVERQMVSDDGERVNELLGLAGSKMLGAAKNFAERGRALAEKGVSHMHTGNEGEYYYLDGEKNPQGPISREELVALFHSGSIQPDTSILKNGNKNWSCYRDLNFENIEISNRHAM